MENCTKCGNYILVRNNEKTKKYFEFLHFKSENVKMFYGRTAKKTVTALYRSFLGNTSRKGKCGNAVHRERPGREKEDLNAGQRRRGSL